MNLAMFVNDVEASSIDIRNLQFHITPQVFPSLFITKSISSTNAMHHQIFLRLSDWLTNNKQATHSWLEFDSRQKLFYSMFNLHR